jgi:hypothetical protein
MAIGSSNIMSLVRMIGDHTIELSSMLEKSIDSIAEREFMDPYIIRKSIQKYYYRITRELRKSLIRPILLSRIGINMQDVLDISFFITNVNDVSENLSLLINSIKASKSSFQNQFGENNFITKVIRVLKNSIDSFLFKNSSSAIEQIKIIDNLKKSRLQIERNYSDKSDENILLPLLIELSSKILDQSRIICFSALRRAI